MSHTQGGLPDENGTFGVPSPGQELSRLTSHVGADAAWIQGLRAAEIPPTLTAWPEAFRELNSLGERDVLLIGKGPTFDRAAPWLESHPEAISIGLNHVVQRMPVTIAHLIDLDVLDQVDEAAWWNNCEKIVIPWQPHIRFRPTVASLRTVEHPLLRRLIQAGRVVWYNLSTAARRGYSVRPPGPFISCRSFSGEAVMQLLISAGRSSVFTAGIDGGTAYSGSFGHLKPLTNGQPSFDLQTRILRSLPIEICNL